MGSTNSAECCEFDMKNRPITSEDIVHARTVYCCCKECLISGGALNYEWYYSSSCTVVVQTRSTTSNMYVQSFVFAGRIEWRFLESMMSAESRKFDKKNRPIASEGIIQGGRTCSDCLLQLQSLISGGTLKYECYFYSSSCTVVVVVHVRRVQTWMP